MIKKYRRYYDPSTIRVTGGLYYYGEKAPDSYTPADKFITAPVSDLESHPLYAHYVSLVEAQFLNPESIGDGGQFSLIRNGAWIYKADSGDITSKSFDDLIVKSHYTKFRNYEQRKNLGEVMVSDYAHGRATVKYSDGIDTVSRVFKGSVPIWLTEVGASSSCRDLCRRAGYPDHSTSWSAAKSKQMIKVAPNVWMSLQITVDHYEYVQEIGHHAADYGFNFGTIKSHVTTNEAYPMESQIPIDGALVTAVVADANQGDMDILTFLSELPMTIATALAGIAKVGEMSRDLRTLDIKKSRISQSLLQKWRRKHWEQLRRKVPKKQTPRSIFQRYEQVATALAGELLDATAIVNLWWRYDLRPNIYSLDDHLNHVENMLEDNGRRRYRKKLEVPFDMPQISGFTWEGESTYEYRYTCVRHYYTSDWLSKVKRSLTTDKVVTLWELLWGSFMVDWFLNIGDVLAAMPSRDPLLKCDEGFTVSQSTIIRGRYILDSNPSVYATVTVNGYKRAKISPEKYIGFYFRNKLDLWKIFDAACIAWGLSRPKLRKTPIFTFL